MRSHFTSTGITSLPPGLLASTTKLQELYACAAQDAFAPGWFSHRSTRVPTAMVATGVNHSVAQRNQWDGALPAGLLDQTPQLRVFDIGGVSGTSAPGSALSSLPADFLQNTPLLTTLCVKRFQSPAREIVRGARARDTRHRWLRTLTIFAHTIVHSDITDHEVASLDANFFASTPDLQELSVERHVVGPACGARFKGAASLRAFWSTRCAQQVGWEPHHVGP